MVERDIVCPKVCGVLVEPRRMANVHVLIENFKKVMSDTTLFFFCGKSHYDYYSTYYNDDNIRKFLISHGFNFEYRGALNLCIQTYN